MKFGLLAVLGLLLGSLTAHFLMQDKGYVLINFRGYSIEMSVPILILILITLYFAIRLVLRLIKVPRELGEKAASMRQRSANKQFVKGLIQMAEGNWARGEKMLTRGVRRSETPLLNYLAAARAAQLQGAHERRDQWLKMAYEQTPEAANAILLTQAELQIAHQQYEEALATLRQLEEKQPNHTQGLALLARIYEELGDWQSLLDLMPRLKKRKSLAGDRLDDLSKKALGELIDVAGHERDPTALDSAWKAVPRALREQLFHRYVAASIACGRLDQIEPEIRKALGKHWDEDLVLLYGQLHTGSADKQLRHAENWLKSHADDVALLLTAARLCMRSELWGKARSYLESALAIESRPDAYHEYGRLLETLGETNEASEAFRSGLILAAGGDSGRPALVAPDPVDSEQ